MTGISFLDVWTIFHVAFWLVVGSLLWSREYAAAKAGKPTHRTAHLIGCMVVALAWEAFEKGAEKWWPAYWLNPESWYNSWVSDPLTCIVGVLGAFFVLNRWRKP